MSHKLTINKSYYSTIAHEFNLPVGHTCPASVVCKVCVDRETGKQTNESTTFKCYAASSERFPAVRARRWQNYDFVKGGGVVRIPSDCKFVRIHQSGDFFSQDYFDMWLSACKNHPFVSFWAFTKSINFWAERFGEIPNNLILTASYGGKYDHLIKMYGLKSVKVIKDMSESGGLPIDSNVARVKEGNFNILDTNVRGRNGCADIGAGDPIKKTTVYAPNKAVLWSF